MRAAEARLGERGRILVRASGTERIIRVMVEGPHEEEVRELAEGVATVVRDRMGTPPEGAVAEA